MTSDRHYRRNFIAFIGDYVGFGLAMSFASSTTILPEFASQLTGNEVVIGLLATVSTGAWLLPQLIYARFLSKRRRKKPFVTLGAAIGRPFYLFYAAALGLGLHHHPLLALALLFAVQIVFYGTDAMAAVAWFDVLAKSIPDRQRGRLLGIAQAIRGLLAIGAGLLIGFMLGDTGPPFPHNYALIFALAGAWLLLSLLSWSFVVEPDEPVGTAQRPRQRYRTQLLEALGQDRRFRRLLVVRLLAGSDGLALSFYILFATRNLGLPSGTVGLFTVVQTIGGILSSVVLGSVSARVGPHRVVQIATALSLTGPLMGWGLFLSDVQSTALATALCAWIFLVIGVTLNANMLGFYSQVLELAPAGRRPTYIGLFNTISGVLVLLPPLGGWLLQKTSYGVLFGLTTAILALTHGLSWRLPSTRERATCS